MANIIEYLDPIRLVYTTDYSSTKVGTEFKVNSEFELVEINPVVFDEEPTRADLNGLDEEFRIAVKDTGAYILCIESNHYGRSAATVGVELSPCYISEYTTLYLRYSDKSSASANLLSGVRHPYLCAYKVASDERGIRLARCGDLSTSIRFSEQYSSSELMRPGAYVEFSIDVEDEEDEEQVTIKAGTYRFNEKPEISSFFEMALPITCGGVDYSYLVNDVDEDDEALRLCYLNSADDFILAYSSEPGEGVTKGWQDDSRRIFSVRADTKVAATRGAWFENSTEEYTGGDAGEDVTGKKIIKAGTYRWNDEVTFPPYVNDGYGTPFYHFSQSIKYIFTTSITVGSAVYTVECEGDSVMALSLQNGTNEIQYQLISMTPPFMETPYRPYVYSTAEGGWKVYAYGEGVKTFTVLEDTVVEDEVFATWLTTNTKEVKAISGKRRFKDTITSLSYEKYGFTCSLADRAYRLEKYGVDISPVSLTYEGYNITITRITPSFFCGDMFDDNGKPTIFIEELSLGVTVDGGEYIAMPVTPSDIANQVFDFGTELQYIPVDAWDWVMESTDPYVEKPKTVKEKIQSLIDKANATTGKSDSDLTSGVKSLIAGYGQGSICHNPHVYHTNSADELPDDAADGSLAVVTETEYGWAKKTWNGLTNFGGCYVWTDGDNTYFSDGDTHYVLNGDTWESKEWKGLTFFYRDAIWKYGENVYYSNTDGSYILNGDTWEETTFNCEQNLNGSDIFTHNEVAYFVYEKYVPSSGSFVYYIYLLRSNAWGKIYEIDNLCSLVGIWSDGKNLFYCDNGVWDSATSSVVYGIYKLNGNTWEKISSNEFSVGRSNFWTDGNTLYYAYVNYENGEMVYKNYIFTDGVFEETDQWNISKFSSSPVWTDGVNTYYSDGGIQYVLGEIQVNTLYARTNGSWVSEEDENFSIQVDCTADHIFIVDELPTQNIVDGATYKCGDSYYRYGKELTDVRYDAYSLAELLGVTAPVNYYYVSTKPTENIAITSEADSFHIYYVEDENDLFLYGELSDIGENVWASISEAIGATFNGVISNESEATEEGLYAVVSNGFQSYVAPKGTLEITENGTYDVSEKASVVVNTSNSAVVGAWEFGNYIANGDKFYEAVNFTTKINGVAKNCIAMEVDCDNGAGWLIFHTEDETFIVYHSAYFGEIRGYTYSGDHYMEEWSRTVDFGSDPQVIYAARKEWLTVCATPIQTVITVASVEDLPTNATYGSLAIVLGGD